MRIMIDVTRPPHTGIGRYSWGLLQKLVNFDLHNDYCGLVYPGWEKYCDLMKINLPDTFMINTQPVDIHEARKISREIENRADIFVSTSFSTFHLIKRIPVIQVVHDIIYVLHPEWQPTLLDLRVKHGNKRVDFILNQLLPIMEDYVAAFNDKWKTEEAFQPAKDAIISMIFQTVFSYYIHKASGLITVSETISNQLLNYYSNLPEIITIKASLPTYLDKNIIYEKSHNYLRLLYVANFEPRKNHNNLLRTLDMLKETDINAHLYLVGRQHYASHYNNFSKSHPKFQDRNDITHMSFVDNSTLSKLYKSTDIFLFPSIEEGFGLPLLEAMYMEVPTVAVDIPTTREIGGDSIILANSGKAQDLFKGICLVHNTPEIKRELKNKQNTQIIKYATENAESKQVKLFLSLVEKL